MDRSFTLVQSTLSWAPLYYFGMGLLVVGCLAAMLRNGRQ